MCQAGSDLFVPAGAAPNGTVKGFADAQMPIAPRHLGGFWPGPAQPVQEAAALVAQHVVTRLVAGHAFRVPEAAALSGVAHSASETVLEFVELLLGDDPEAALLWVTMARRRGTACEAICHDVLAPASRRLRALWRNDDCDYAAYRLGVWRLHRLLQTNDHTEVCRRAAHRDPACVLLLTLPGCESSFEHTLVTQYFARSGWATHCHVADGALENLVRSNRFHVAWISIDDTVRQHDIGAVARTVRRASQNRGIGILCGGFELDPMPAAWEVGADAMAADARTALAVAERWRMWQAEEDGTLAEVA